MSGKFKLTPEDDDTIFEMLENHKEKPEIAAALGVSTRTIQRRVLDAEYLAYALSRRVNVGRTVEKIASAKPERAEAQRELPKSLPTRMEMLAQLAAWAAIDPSLTKHDISSQKAAHDELWMRLGYQGLSPDPDGVPGNPEPDVFVAEWLRPAGKPQ